MRTCARPAPRAGNIYEAASFSCAIFAFLSGSRYRGLPAGQSQSINPIQIELLDRQILGVVSLQCAFDAESQRRCIEVNVQ